ncbi:LbetaH domain-containing protein [Chryseobacterium schmidteae]|uniref:acetyltransferase n=1 Tax=Chryseobacterium schmidteae TaxID=2730404 RepID=UPI00158A7C22|nr:acetyltransferase [Chryseobacterium schmidteae]
MFKRYGFLGSLKLFVSLIYTKIVYKQARLIRLPFDIRNKKNIKLGKNFTAGFGCRIEAFPDTNHKDKICISIGDNVQINDYVHIGAISSICIGDNVLIASKIYITDHNHGNYSGEDQDSPLSIPQDRKSICSPVVIKDNVWIGESVCIMPGVTIGEGTIIGALSVVTKDIPQYCIAVGSPAKVIKKYNFTTNVWDKF